MFIDKILTAIFGSQNDRDLKALKPILAKVNAKRRMGKITSSRRLSKTNRKIQRRIKTRKNS